MAPVRTTIQKLAQALAAVLAPAGSSPPGKPPALDDALKALAVAVVTTPAWLNVLAALGLVAANEPDPWRQGGLIALTVFLAVVTRMWAGGPKPD